MRDEKVEMRNEGGVAVTSSEQEMNETAVSDKNTDVDVQALAEAIVTLLKQELRVENERQGR